MDELTLIGLNLKKINDINKVGSVPHMDMKTKDDLLDKPVGVRLRKGYKQKLFHLKSQGVDTPKIIREAVEKAVDEALKSKLLLRD